MTWSGFVKTYLPSHIDDWIEELPRQQMFLIYQDALYIETMLGSDTKVQTIATCEYERRDMRIIDRAV